MDELMMDSQVKSFIDAINGLKEIDDKLLDDEALDTLMNKTILFTPETVQQSINQIINNLEVQNQTRQQVIDTVKSLKDFINEMLYGDTALTGNKKILIDYVAKNLFEIFDAAADKYHNYAIELPMTVDTKAGAKAPTFAHDTDAAADLYAMESQIIPAHSYGNMIHTGVKLQLPEGWLAMILPRSSMGVKTPLRLSNSVGLIDSGYRGELGVIYDNTSEKDYEITAGDRIAQLLVMPSYRFKAKVVDILEDSDRGEGGFGSSGT